MFTPLAIFACNSPPAPAPPPPAAPEVATPDVVFIVLDTVRADHLSLCGYDRPTTPTLQQMAKDGYQWTCGAVAPGDWTLPSHASFFTGVDPVDHRAHTIASGVKDLSGWSARTRKLDKKLPTLAEDMIARGYQTLALSSNPVVNDKMGLLRGFETRQFPEKDFGELHGEAYTQALAPMLDKADPNKPLFLFLNISDAHQPWTAVPDGLGWVPQQPRFRYAKHVATKEWFRYVDGTMPEEERVTFRARIRDQYDYGVFQADQNMANSLKMIRERGFCGEDCRIVITSDHGEYLGEHGLLDHGHYVYEGNIRVPLLAQNVKGEMPELVSALHAYHLVRDGELPNERYPAQAMAWPHVRRCARTNGKAFCDLNVALWESKDQKLMHIRDETLRFNLSTDPLEQSPTPVATNQAVQALMHRAKSDARDDSPMDDEVAKQLQALGYMD